MRVLHFYKTSCLDSVGGIEQVIHQIASGTCRLGVQTDVLTLTTHSKYVNPIKMNGYLSHRAKQDFQIASAGFSISAIQQFSRLAKKADIIHYHFPWPFMDLVHFAMRVRKPTILTYHSDIVRQKLLLKLYRPLQNKFLSSVDRIVATSSNYLASSNVLSSFREKTVVIPIGLERASYPQPREERLAYWSKKIGRNFFLFVGVLRYYKGLRTLLDAAKNAHYTIVIVGSGPLEEDLKSAAVRLNLKNVYFLGYLSEEDKITLLKLCYAFIFPSDLRAEAFGVSLLEGAMYGKPMISCEISTGTTFVNIHGKTGITVPPGDAKTLCQSMQYLWNNPKEAAEMGARAEEHYWKYFTAEQMVNRYMALYRTLMR